jgi:hypothetical protein
LVENWVALKVVYWADCLVDSMVGQLADALVEKMAEMMVVEKVD